MHMSKKENTAYLLAKLIKKKKVPKSKYLRESAKRITIDKKHIEKIEIKEDKDKQKQYYFNPNKGLRR